jgi:hypothetical protein
MNRIKFSIYFVLIFSVFTAAQKQGIYIPSEIEKLYNGNTRAWDGRPGEGYWQNSADYKIKVTLNTDTREIYGEETIVYFNNSPDTLNEIIIQLFPDIYETTNPRDWRFSKESLTNGTKINSFKIAGAEIDIDTSGYKYSTNLILTRLPAVILPKSTVRLEIEWEFTVPEKSKLRMGKYGDGVFFIAYWYPKIAVYDDYYGWDELNYTGSTEFYSDFNNYDVTITLPGEFLVWATGDLQNADEVLHPQTFSKYKKALYSDEVVRIVTEKDYEDDNVTSDNSENDWRFIARNVPDFSFACSDTYLWDGVSVVVDENQRRVLTDAAYAPGTINYENAAFVSKLCLEYLSYDMPGIPFPYSHMTSFCNGNRGGGMETPMMANNGAPRDSAGFETLLLHEIAHSYFPFYVGINERRSAWMEEGWATYFPRGYSNKYLDNYSHFDYVLGFLYALGLGTEQDLPIIIPSNNLRGAPLTVNSYGKSFIAFLELEKMLGGELFRKALREYIESWNGKHPLPYDFFFSFNQTACEDLSWFWEAWFYDFGTCDYALEKDGKEEIYLVKVGLLPASISVKVYFEDESSETIIVNASEWKDGKAKMQLEITSSKKIVNAFIDTSETLDTNPDNNRIEF